MSRFQDEWNLVPAAAKVLAALAALFILMLMGLVFLVPPMAERGMPPLMLWGFFALTSVPSAAMLAVYVLLLGYVWADAGRRGMSQAGWTLIALFVPMAIGIILYFVVREPLPASCRSCGALVPRGQACCTGCGAALATTCPECQRPVEPTWAHCGGCGAALRATAKITTP
jgi:hypothetical protein